MPVLTSFLTRKHCLVGWAAEVKSGCNVQSQQAVSETEQVGLVAFGQSPWVAEMNQDFCSMEFFSVVHGINKGLQGSELFQNIPEATRMLCQHGEATISKNSTLKALTNIFTFCTSSDFSLSKTWWVLCDGSRSSSSSSRSSNIGVHSILTWANDFLLDFIL